MSTLGIQGKTRVVYPVRNDLIPTVDPHYGLYQEASTDHKGEVGHRSGEECRTVHSGTFTGNFLRRATDATRQREKSTGHGRGHSECPWGNVSLKNVFLTRIVRVSTASWQPDLFVEQPSAASQAIASPWPLGPLV